MSDRSQLHKLQKEWYKKLKDEGFNDIEQEDGKLKDWSSKFYLNHHKDSNHKEDYEEKEITNSAKEQYYRIAEHFLNDYIFSNRVEKQIWKLHSEGFSYREIARKLGPNVDIILNKDKINSLIKRLSKKMLSWVKYEELKNGRDDIKN